MQGKYVERKLQIEINSCLKDFPAVSILGPRQCGKSTLARKIIRDAGDTVYLDLELPSDIQKLSEPELFFRRHRGKLICLDEIQRMPEIFPVLRSLIDEDRVLLAAGKHAFCYVPGRASMEIKALVAVIND